MNFFCRLFGHTWSHRTENPRISWNTAKNLSELDHTTEVEEPRFWLECARCGHTNENPSKDEIRRINN